MGPSRESLPPCVTEMMKMAMMASRARRSEKTSMKANSTRAHTIAKRAALRRHAARRSLAECFRTAARSALGKQNTTSPASLRAYAPREARRTASSPSRSKSGEPLPGGAAIRTSPSVTRNVPSAPGVCCFPSRSRTPTRAQSIATPVQCKTQGLMKKRRCKTRVKTLRGLASVSTLVQPSNSEVERPVERRFPLIPYIAGRLYSDISLVCNLKNSPLVRVRDHTAVHVELVMKDRER